jgi:hypothetical protein
MKTMITKEYFKIKGQTKEIEVSVGYELGGHSYFTGENSSRGYYMYVRPVERAGNFISFMMFEGFKCCLLPVNRQSKKQEEIALAAAKEIMLIKAKELATSKDWELEGDKSNE